MPGITTKNKKKMKTCKFYYIYIGKLIFVVVVVLLWGLILKYLICIEIEL